MIHVSPDDEGSNAPPSPLLPMVFINTTSCSAVFHFYDSISLSLTFHTLRGSSFIFFENVYLCISPIYIKHLASTSSVTPRLTLYKHVCLFVLSAKHHLHKPLSTSLDPKPGPHHTSCRNRLLNLHEPYSYTSNTPHRSYLV